MRPISPLALIISTGLIQAENTPLESKPKVSGIYYWTPSAIFARLKHAKESNNRIEVRSHSTNSDSCNSGCVLEGTCAHLECAPDFHQCGCAADVDKNLFTYYPCDVDECEQTTHHCQRYDCDLIEYPINYFQCRWGCLGVSHTVDICAAEQCAPEYGRGAPNKFPKPWTYFLILSGYCLCFFQFAQLPCTTSALATRDSSTRPTDICATKPGVGKEITVTLTFVGLNKVTSSEQKASHQPGLLC